MLPQTRGKGLLHNTYADQDIDIDQDCDTKVGEPQD